MTKIEKQIRKGLPMVGYAPYGQVHAHSTGNPNSTVQNEADYMNSKDINSGFYTHVVGNGRIIQVAAVNRGAWDLGGGWNEWGYASVELIESHKNAADFMQDYAIYVNLLRDLAKEAKLPLTVDKGNVGVISHAYATANQPNNYSDHIDPYPYLAKWGISRKQFAKDIEKGLSAAKPAKPSKPKPNDKPKPSAKTVTVLAHASRYSQSSKGVKIASFIKGKAWRVLQERPIKHSRSNREYLIAGKDEKTPIGWILSQDIKGGHGSTESKPKPKPSKPAGLKWTPQKGKFYPKSSLPLTVDASGKGKLIAKVPAGDFVKYDAFCHANGYVWIRQPRAGGKYGYMATGNSKNGKRTSHWGSFKA